VARGGKRPGAGRKPGTPNKVTAEDREVFRMVYERRLSDLDRWITETGDGFEAVHFLKDGTKIPYIEKNPGKAADILVRMAEHFVPKLARNEHVGADGGPVEFVIRDIAKEGE
jgi:hypothetical protein